MSVSLLFSVITLVTVIYCVMQDPRTSFESGFLMLDNILQVMNLVFQLHRAAVTFFGGTLLGRVSLLYLEKPKQQMRLRAV